MSFYSGFSSGTKNIVCHILGIIPDKLFLKIMYRIKTGRKLNLDNPKTYSEKINWLKMYDHNPLYTKLVDKYEVRKYVESIIGKEYLFPLFGVWENFDDINFETLPSRFVIKCTHDFGSVIIVEDKNNIDIRAIKKAINEELKYNFFYRGREWAYKNVKPRIIVEKNMQNGKEQLVDYKFFCFGGKVKFMYMVTGRGRDMRIDYFSRDFEHLDVENSDGPNADIIPQKPVEYEEMICLAEKLANKINNVRVDLYNIDGNIFFSEMTFYPSGGVVALEPYEMDVELGQYFVLEKYKKN